MIIMFIQYISALSVRFLKSLAFITRLGFGYVPVEMLQIS